MMHFPRNNPKLKKGSQKINNFFSTLVLTKVIVETGLNIINFEMTF